MQIKMVMLYSVIKNVGWLPASLHRPTSFVLASCQKNLSVCYNPSKEKYSQWPSVSMKDNLAEQTVRKDLKALHMCSFSFLLLLPPLHLHLMDICLCIQMLVILKERDLYFCPHYCVKVDKQPHSSFYCLFIYINTDQNTFSCILS